MDKKPFYYRMLLVIVLVGAMPVLACNFPFQANRSGQVNNLQHTLTALATLNPDDHTPTPVSDEVDTPLPGNTSNAIPTTTSFQRPEPPQLDAGGISYTYLARSGDTLQAVAKRFGVEPGQITSLVGLPGSGLLIPEQVLVIPNELGEIRYTEILLPDSEVVNSPSARDFNVEEFILAAGGYLGEHRELVNGSWLSGADIVSKVSLENSINPRLLLALLEQRSGWVYGELDDTEQLNYPIGFYVPDYKGLYYEMVLTATHLGVGYYGWRSGEKISLTFQDGSWLRLAPGLNPGTAALQTFLSKISDQEEWRTTLYGTQGFVELYATMFGDPWSWQAQYGTLLPEGLTQPELLLPFSLGERWSFTGGPHRSWNAGSPRGALDFSPVTGEPVCTISRAWVTASAEGIITRASDNVMAIDLDADGYEQTGWVLVYLHIVAEEDALLGGYVAADAPLGHPSCERGNSTGTHIHLARKFNGEWIPAGGALPFVLSGWEAQMGERNYQGSLHKGDRSISANPGGPSSSLIIRED
jgi:LasA protease